MSFVPFVHACWCSGNYKNKNSKHLCGSQFGQHARLPSLGLERENMSKKLYQITSIKNKNTLHPAVRSKIRQNSSLQAVCDTPTARTTGGCVFIKDCCSQFNSHNQVRGHRTGSSHSGAEEYPREKHTQPKVVHAYITADAIHASTRNI